MNLRLDKKHYIIILAAAVLAVLVYFGVFYLYLAPLKTSLSLKENQLKMEQQLHSTLNERLASVNETDFSSTAELQKRLPVDPMVEQLVLDVEKAEVISNCFVSSIEFNSKQQEITPFQQETSSLEQDAQVNEESGVDHTNSEIEITNSQLAIPDGLLKTTAQIIVKADNYFILETFIATLESLKRVLVVESITFSGPEETDILSDEEVPIEMMLTINAFYFPELGELKEYNPKVETPEPANKRNPFPTFGDYSKYDLTENEQPNVDETVEIDGN